MHRDSRSTIPKPTTRLFESAGADGFGQTQQRRIERVRANINDATFVDAVVTAFEGIAPKLQRRA